MVEVEEVSSLPNHGYFYIWRIIKINIYVNVRRAPAPTPINRGLHLGLGLTRRAQTFFPRTVITARSILPLTLTSIAT